MNILKEVLTWVYAGILGILVLLFFCLILDVFCGLCFGWDPLVGRWPIFTGTISAGVYGSTGLVFSLILGISGSTRFALGDRKIYLIEVLFVEKFDGQPEESGK